VAAAFDLTRLRAERLRLWHLAGNPITDVDQALDFLRHTGFVLSHRARTLLLPSFVEALAGGKEGVPAYEDAAGHPLYARYVAIRHHPRVKKLALELPILRRRHALVLREHVVDFAALLAEPRGPDRRSGESRAAARRIVALIADRGPTSKRTLRLALVGWPAAVRGASLDRVLLDLESRLVLVTVDYTAAEGAVYDLFARAHRALAVRAARQGRGESLDRLLARYVRSARAVEPARGREVLRGFADPREIQVAQSRLLAGGRIASARVGGGEWLWAPD
jgi:hypothetical protein